MDKFGASDAWLMFSLWMGAEGHFGASVAGLVMCILSIAALGGKAQDPQR